MPFDAGGFGRPRAGALGACTQAEPPERRERGRCVLGAPEAVDPAEEGGVLDGGKSIDAVVEESAVYEEELIGQVDASFAPKGQDLGVERFEDCVVMAELGEELDQAEVAEGWVVETQRLVGSPFELVVAGGRAQ